MSPDPDPNQPDVIRNCIQAHAWLKNKNLLVPLDVRTTLSMSLTMLFHILELLKMPGEIAQAIHVVTWLLGEVEEETVAEATRSAVNDHIDLLNV